MLGTMLGAIVSGTRGRILYPAWVIPKLLDKPNPIADKPPADPNPIGPRPAIECAYATPGVRICCAPPPNAIVCCVAARE